MSGTRKLNKIGTIKNCQKNFSLIFSLNTMDLKFCLRIFLKIFKELKIIQILNDQAALHKPPVYSMKSSKYLSFSWDYPFKYLFVKTLIFDNNKMSGRPYSLDSHQLWKKCLIQICVLGEGWIIGTGA
jgi:hypothetical protein